MKNIRSYLALLTSLMVASLISFSLGITSTLWYLQPVLSGAPMTAASASTTSDHNASSAVSRKARSTVDVLPVNPASEIPRTTPQRLNALLPAAGAKVPDSGDDIIKMGQRQENVGDAASAFKGASPEVATASSASPSSPAPPTASPTSVHAAEAPVRKTVVAPLPTKSAPAKKAAQLASSAGQMKRTLSATQSGRGAVFQLQLGAFLNTSNANRFQKDLNKQGFPVKVSPKTDRQGRVWQIARLGVYSNRLTAMEAAARFRRDTGLEAIVMKNTPIDEG